MTCTKMPFETKKEAKKKLKVLCSHGKSGQTIYRCIMCGKFHLTSQTKKIAKSYRKKRIAGREL